MSEWDYMNSIYGQGSFEAAMQQQQRAQMQQQRELETAMAKALKSKTITAATNASAWTYDLWSTTDASILVTNATTSPPAKPQPETNLAWLDRRVKEMRVAL